MHRGRVEIQLWSFLPTVLDGGGWSTPYTLPLYLPLRAQIPIAQGDGWVLGPVWKGVEKGKSVVPLRFEHRTVQPIAIL
jgi:hypothetical protein